jgi:HK97 family phage major capsid protein
MTREQMMARMRQIVDTAKREQRRLTADEEAEFNHLETYASVKPVEETRGSGSGGRTAEDKAFTHYLRTGYVSPEMRTDGTGLSSAPNDAGVSAGSTGDYAGYMVPQSFWANLQIALRAYGGVASQFKQVNTETGAPMPWPTVNPTAYTGHLLGASSELTQLSLEDPYNFGQGMLNSWVIYAGPILASLPLVQDSAFDVDQFVSDRLGEGIGRGLAAQAISGTGSGAPLGVITAINAFGAWSAGNSGGYVNLTAAKSVTTFGGSTTELSGNVLAPSTLINMVQAVDPAYYPSCAWFMTPTQAWNTHSIVDSNGRPLISFLNGYDTVGNVTDPNYTHGSAVASLFGFPVYVDANLPTLTASTTGGPLFGSLQHAMVQRNAGRLSVMRLVERWADYLAVGYLGFIRVDMRSNDMRAVVTVKPAST